jgi:hypothetical protein
VSSLRSDRIGMIRGFVMAMLATALLAGCGESSSAGSAATQSRTVTVSTGSVAASKPTAHRTDTHQRAAPAHPSGAPAPSEQVPASISSGASAQPSPAPSGGLVRRFTGSGNERLGTIVLHAQSVLSWHVQHGPIQIFTSSGFLLVQSQQPNGSVRLSRGTYRGVRVASHAGWSIELRARTS